MHSVTLSGLISPRTAPAHREAIEDAISADDATRAVAAKPTHLRRVLACLEKAQEARPDFPEEAGEPAPAPQRKASA